MAGGFSKIIVANVITNQPGGTFQTVTVSSVGIGNTTSMNAGVSSAQYIPAGSYIYPATANVAVEVNIGTGGNNTWTTWYAANTAGWVESDGYNVRANASTGTQTVTLYTINGGQAATQSSYASS
jgi:uncharacterized protein YigE (DUF2233 family)